MTPVFGQDDALASFAAAITGDRLHHAWLLAGPQGVGKARFAEAAALRLLASVSGTAVTGEGLDVPDDHPATKLFAAGSHPDFKRVQREVWKGDQIVPVDDRKDSDQPARNIRVAQIRELDRMMMMAPSLGSRRVILIDSADDLERSSANALLKRLEEPPPGTIFLLVSHAPGRLLPTIRSRCRTLRFGLLDETAMERALRGAMPDASDAEIAALVPLGEGSPGRAMGFAGLDVAALDDSMTRLIREGDVDNGVRVALSKGLAAKAAQPRFELFLQRVPARIAEEAKRRRGAELAQAIRLWEQARSLAASAGPLSLDPQAVAFELGGMLAALAEPASGSARRG